MFIKTNKHSQENLFEVLMNAFKYGAQPHGRIAFGFDRMVMIIGGETSIHDTIAFPKIASAISWIDNSPPEVRLCYTRRKCYSKLNLPTGRQD